MGQKTEVSDIIYSEAKYVEAASCCTQLLLIKQQLEDYRVVTDCITIMCDNTRAMNMAKNPVHHKRTKHIDVRHHFLRDNVEKGLIFLEFCKIEDQVADIFIKALSRVYFERNRLDLGLIRQHCSTPNDWLVKLKDFIHY